MQLKEEIAKTHQLGPCAKRRAREVDVSDVAALPSTFSFEADLTMFPPLVVESAVDYDTEVITITAGLMYTILN